MFHFMIPYGYTQFFSLYKMVLDILRLLYICEEINDFQILTISLLFKSSVLFGLVRNYDVGLKKRIENRNFVKSFLLFSLQNS